MNKKSSIWIIAVIVVLAGVFYVMSVSNPQPSNPNGGIGSPSGLRITVLKEGSGDEIQNGNVAVVHYTGTLDDGTVFDSSIPRGAPFEFTLGFGQVIQGWDLGVLGMQVGEKRKLVINPELAYGSAQRGPIPPNSRLTFEVELVEIR